MHAFFSKKEASKHLQKKSILGFSVVQQKQYFSQQRIDINKWCNISHTLSHGKSLQVLTRRDQLKLKETLKEDKDNKKNNKTKGDGNGQKDQGGEGGKGVKGKGGKRKRDEEGGADEVKSDKPEPKAKGKAKAKGKSKAKAKAKGKVLEKNEKSDDESEEMATPKRRLFHHDSADESEEQPEREAKSTSEVEKNQSQGSKPAEPVEVAAAVPKKRAKAKAQPKEKAKAKAKAKSKGSPNTKVSSPSIKKEQKRRKKAAEDYQCESAEEMADRRMQDLYETHLKHIRGLPLMDLKDYLQTNMPNTNKHGCKVAYWSRSTASVGVSVYMDLKNSYQSKAHFGYFSFKLANDWTSNMCIAFIAAHLMVSGLEGFVGGVMLVHLDQKCSCQK